MSAECFDLDQDILQAWHQGLAPDPSLTVSEWADRYRVLSPRGSAEPGPWRTSRTPYLREIMDTLSPSHPARRVVFMKSAQVGGTECGNNWIGYVIHLSPNAMLAVQPTVELAKRFSRQRIDPLIRETAVLRRRVAPSRARDSGNTVLSKEFGDGILVMTGANSAVGLRQMSAPYLFLDEIDAYDEDVDGEGDPVALVEARSQSFGWRRKIFLVSTPTIAGRSRIEREYEASDRRKYFVPCPHCGHMQWLRFERLRWSAGDYRSVRYCCEACEREIGEYHKGAMLAAGEWRATATAGDPDTVGFHISALYSPPGWLTWAEIARKWDVAQGKPEALKSFKNIVLGETWQERGDAPDWQRLLERRERRDLGVVPDEAVVLTAGVDVQDDRLECSVWGWAEGFTSWLIDHHVIQGDPRAAEVWNRLVELLDASIEDESGRPRRIERACVDTGGRDTTAVYRHLVRIKRFGLIAPTKGIEGWNRTEPVRGPTKVFHDLVHLWTFSASTWKSELYRRLWLQQDGDGKPAGWVHIPDAISAEWVKQLVAEELRTIRDKRGFARYEWAKLRERNEALDCAVLARVALYLLGADARGERFWAERVRQLGDEEAVRIEKPPPPVTRRPERPAYFEIEPNSWF